MSKSLVLFLLFASITSAYAESATSDNSKPIAQKDGLIAEASDEPSMDALMMEPIAVHPIVVEQTPTTAEQLARSAYDAITSAKAPAAETAKVKAETIAHTDAKPANNSLIHAETKSPTTPLASQPLDLAQVKSEKPLAVPISESVTTAKDKAALDKMLFEQIHTATTAPEKTVSIASQTPNSTQQIVKDEKLTTVSSEVTKPANPSMSLLVAKNTTTPTMAVALDKPLLEQMEKVNTSVPAKSISAISIEKIAAPKEAIPLESFAKTTSAVIQKSKGKPAPGFVAPVSEAFIPVASQVVVEVKTNKAPQLLNTENAVPTQITLDQSQLQAKSVSPQTVLAPVAVPTKLAAQTSNSKLVRDEFFEKALPERVNVAKAAKTAKENGTVNFTSTTLALTETAIPLKLTQTVKKAEAITKIETAKATPNPFQGALASSASYPQPVLDKTLIKKISTANAIPATIIESAKTVTNPAPGSLAASVASGSVVLDKTLIKPTNTAAITATTKVASAKVRTNPAPGSLASATTSKQIALDKTLVEQLNTASAASTKVSIKPAPTAMLAENTPSPEMVLENGLHQRQPVKALSELSTLPVIPVGRITTTKAQSADSTKPAAGSLGSHPMPAEKMIADNGSSMPAKVIDAATTKEPAKAESVTRGIPTDLSNKSNLDKLLLSSVTAPVMASGKITDVPVPTAMLALETPSNATTASADSTLLDQIPSAKVEPVLAPKKPNSFSTAMIERVTGFKGVFNSKDNVYKISVPRDDLNIVVNGVKLTSAMGLTSWIAFKNTPDFTALKGNLVLTEEQVNAVMFTAIENNLNVTELHSHYLWESPKVVFMHIEAEGDTKKLAQAINKVFAKIKESSQGNGDFPIAIIDTANSTLTPQKIEMILGAKGALTDGVYKIRIAKMAKSTALIPANPAQASNASATFAGSDDEAVLDGDIAMQAPQLQKVLSALHKAGISIVAINQRMINDKTRYVFLHYWGVGKTAELARGLRTALEASVANT